MSGRPIKAGLDYFELDCHMEEKVRLIQAEYGLKGFAIVVKLFQKIYGQYGYYCEWDEDSLLLFMSDNGISSCNEKNLINEIVLACIRRDIFSEQLYRKYRVLTSVGVQKRYLRAVSKREVVNMKKEYLLISVGKNNKNVVINSISDGINSISDVRNSQRREEKSREDNKINMCSKTAQPDSRKTAREFFERIWKLYPVKKGKGQVSDTQKEKLSRIPYEEMERAVKRYKSYVDSIDYLHYQNGSTFFNSGYIDYLDENYTEPERRTGKENGFNNFPQREYSREQVSELEKRLINKQRS